MLVEEWTYVLFCLLWVLYLTVFFVLDWSYEGCLFFTLFTLYALVEEHKLRLIRELMSSFDKRNKNTAIRELIPKRTNFSHSQIAKKILHFENLSHETRLIQINY
jgi:hypothetical protein